MIYYGSSGECIYDENGRLVDRGNTYAQDIGDVTYNGRGDRMSEYGDTSFCSNGNVIREVGGVYYANGKSYRVVGNVLMSSSGRSWMNVDENDDRTIRRIIFNDN